MQNQFDNIVFYDGECGFCSSAVQFILKKRKKTIYFVPLQSEKAEQLLSPFDITIQLDTIYFLQNGKVYDRSSAALKICPRLSGGYPLLFIFYFIPKFIRDPFYNWIARRRHTLKPQACMLPTPEERKLFL